MFECCRQAVAEVVSNSRNKIHQTWPKHFLAHHCKASRQSHSRRNAEKSRFTGSVKPWTLYTPKVTLRHLLVLSTKRLKISWQWTHMNTCGGSEARCATTESAGAWQGRKGGRSAHEGRQAGGRTANQKGKPPLMKYRVDFDKFLL